MKKESGNQPQVLTLEHIAQIAIETTLKNGYHVATIIAEGNRSTALIAITDIPAGWDARMLQMFMLGRELAQEHRIGLLRQVFHISEAWMSEVEQLNAPFVPPSEDPKRREVLMVAGYKLSTRKAEGTVFEMIRDESGKLRALTPLPQPPDTEVASPLHVAFAEGFMRGKG